MVFSRDFDKISSLDQIGSGLAVAEPVYFIAPTMLKISIIANIQYCIDNM